MKRTLLFMAWTLALAVTATGEAETEQARGPLRTGSVAIVVGTVISIDLATREAVLTDIEHVVEVGGNGPAAAIVRGGTGQQRAGGTSAKAVMEGQGPDLHYPHEETIRVTWTEHTEVDADREPAEALAPGTRVKVRGTALAADRVEAVNVDVKPAKRRKS